MKNPLYWLGQFSRPDRPTAVACVAGLWLAAAAAVGSAAYLADQALDLRRGAHAAQAKQAGLSEIALTKTPLSTARHEAIAASLRTRYPGLQVSVGKAGELVIEAPAAEDYPVFEQALYYLASHGEGIRFDVSELCTGKGACARAAYKAVLKGHVWSVRGGQPGAQAVPSEAPRARPQPPATRQAPGAVQ